MFLRLFLGGVIGAQANVSDPNSEFVWQVKKDQMDFAKGRTWPNYERSLTHERIRFE